MWLSGCLGLLSEVLASTLAPLLGMMPLHGRSRKLLVPNRGRGNNR